MREWPAAAERLKLRALDVTDPLAWEAAVAAARRSLGGLDVLVSVAGVLVPGWAHELINEAVDLQLDVNVKGVVHGVRAVVPTLALRNALASLIGYPPVMSELLTRRLEG